MHLSGPSLNAPGNPTGPNSKKIAFFFEIAKTTINVSSGALQGKRQVVQNRVFRPLEAPWSPPEAEPFFPRPPRSTPERALELPVPPRTLPRAPRSPQGPHQIHKVDMLKTLEICVFGPQESQKNAPGRFFDAPSTPQGPSRVATPILQAPPVEPKVTPGASTGGPKVQNGFPRDPQRTILPIFGFRPCRRHPHRPPWTLSGPRRTPSRTPRGPPRES